MSQRVLIESVTKEYGEFKAVNDISLEIKSGEFFTLLGPSGCGKTTLLRMIAGFNKIDKGEIKFDERIINNLPPQKRNIGMVFQNYAIFPHLTVKENVAYGLKPRKVKGAELEERVTNAMKLMQIDQYADRLPSKLSGGQQQRVALARAVVITPDILLMDEPLSNLDAKLRVEMRTSIKKLQKSLGITTVYVTHDQEEALAISDRIAIMNQGKVMQTGKPETIYRKPINRFVADFIGTSCFLKGVCKGEDIIVNGKVVMQKRLRDNYQGEILVSARPENIILKEELPDHLCGTVSIATFLGDYVNYEVLMDDGETLQVNEYMAQKLNIHEVGQRICVKLEKDRVSIFSSNGEEALD